jgi:membrane dipeptidase
MQTINTPVNRSGEGVRILCGRGHREISGCGARRGWTRIARLALGIVLVVGLTGPCVAPAQTADAKAPEARALAVLKQSPFIDGHNDLPWHFRMAARKTPGGLDIGKSQPGLQTDIPRLRQGGLGAQFWAVWIPCSTRPEEVVQTTLEQIDVVDWMIDRWPEVFQAALTADDIVRIHGQGKIACLKGIEGGHSIHESLAVLRQYYRLGVRYMTLTHALNTAWADSATDQPKWHGLTPSGERVIREMNRLGMMVDLSHVSDETMEDALRVTTAPVIFSHSSARAVAHHPRNVPDPILLKLRDNGGVCMVTFVQSFVSEPLRCHREERSQEQERLAKAFDQAGVAAAGADASAARAEAVKKGMEAWDRTHPRPRATLAQVVDHIDHVVKVAGIDHVGVGSDFDGMGPGPVGLEDVSCFKDLVAELFRRGYDEEAVKKITGQNLLRVLRAVEAKEM